ncbi:hypothetical protein [Streptomyces nymphaeiformis]|uniref:Uncharacterized protein n=1 Tax=Streptomyces nymphaeiformis TaxID=2663842 RepID=A0A7W7U346_9ACTN|nr:hypothetical protein [Streptomyces nymphaeiformis]MBB4984160.1 hypothetical protein [Streptomyces nymphaeiformis]
MAQPTAAVVAVSEMAVVRALELAGNRLMGRNGRSDRGTLQRMASWDRHSFFRVTGEGADRVLVGVWEAPAARGVPEELLRVLDAYVRLLLASGHSLHRSDLVQTLSRMPQQVVLPWEADESSAASVTP